MTNPALHDAEHALYLVVGYLFFLPILGSEPIRWRLSYPIRFVMLVVAMPVDTFTGLILGTENTPAKGMTTQMRPPGSPTPVADLHAGGAVMWIGGDAIMLGLHDAGLPDVGPRRPGRHAQPGLAGVRAHGQLREPRHPGRAGPQRAGPGPPAVAAGTGGPAAQPGGGAPEPAVAGARGTIDDDEHLAAYNAYLARLNQPGHRPGGKPGHAPAARPVNQAAHGQPGRPVSRAGRSRRIARIITF